MVVTEKEKVTVKFPTIRNLNCIVFALEHIEEIEIEKKIFGGRNENKKKAINLFKVKWFRARWINSAVSIFFKAWESTM